MSRAALPKRAAAPPGRKWPRVQRRKVRLDQTSGFDLPGQGFDQERWNRPLLSDEHFSVDGTLIEALASHKTFKPKKGSDQSDGGQSRGQTRKNDARPSTTDPQARPMGAMHYGHLASAHVAKVVLEHASLFGIKPGGNVVAMEGLQ
jgi:hypothetical protein